MSYLDAAWLAARHGLAAELAAPLSVVDGLAASLCQQRREFSPRSGIRARAIAHAPVMA
jgi:hypothetical protein